MTTKVTDKGIIYPDGTEQTTAAYGSGGGGSVDAYTKEETDNKFYDKEEIDSLLEGSSVAIVGNYTNKWASSVARDPGAGNLYLAYGVNISTKYDEVTKIYISDTDGDGEVRDFDKVQEDDKITLSSENGSGEYTIVTISDVGGYRELIVSTDASNGTITNDTAVSIVLDVASSGGGSGTGGGSSLPMGSIIMWSIPEVPEGWQICDGTNDTPDLRDKFVVGAGTTYALDATGGSADAVAVSHNHTAPTTVPISGPGGNGGKTGFTWATGGNTVTNKSINSNGVSGVGKNLPPYYALYYIMKMVEGGGSGGGGIEEAPIDGKQYARQDEAWTEVTGGGSTPTPEALVWENKLAERAWNTEYTNTNDVPLYVSVSGLFNPNNTFSRFLIDGVRVGIMGEGSGVERSQYASSLFIVPAGSTYQLTMNDAKSSALQYWHEARMPVAIGVPSVDTAIGMVAPFAMDSVPTGWLHCDGSEVSRDTYSLLYSKVGDTYGAGDGSTTFNLPDLQDEFIRGSSDTLPVGNKQDDELKEHDHFVSSSSTGLSGGFGRYSGTTGPTKSSLTGGEETRPRNVAMLYCINATAEPSSGGGEATGTPSSFARIVDERPEDVSPGNATNGIQDRTLNKIEYDVDNIVTLSNDKEFTLQKGTYVIDFSAPAYIALNTNAWLWSVTDNKKVLQGSTEYGNASNGQSSVWSKGRYVVTLTEAHTYKIQHYINNANGLLGNKAKSGVGIFTTVDIEKVGTGGASSGGDSIWTEEDGKAVYNGTVDLGPVETEQKFNVYNFDSFPNNYSKFGFGGVPFYPRMYFPSDGNLQFGTMSKDGNDTFTNLMQLTNGGSVTTIADMWVNGIRVGQGGGATAQPESTVLGVDVLAANVSGSGNTGIGSNALRRNTSGYSNTAIGRNALTFVVEGANNTGVGSHALGACTGNGNTSIGESAGSATITGNNNTLIGSGAQPSSADVSNEVTIGNGSVTKTRLNGQVTISDNVTINTGELIVPDMTTTSESYNIPNCYISSGGQLVKHTSPSLYSIEEIDKKLAIKDKLIEKLSARLDELEKRVK